MREPLVSVSGVRGIVGESFTEELVRRWTGAFARFCHPERSVSEAKDLAARDSSVASLPQNDRAVRVVLARDTRPSGTWALEVAARTLEAHGVQPVTLGVVPTPTAQLAVTHHRAAAGLVITGSHNPTEWNALKFLGSDGVFLSTEEVERLQKDVILSEAKPSAGTRRGGPRDSSPSTQNDRAVDARAIDRHIENILALPIDVARIQARRFRVVVDPVNGAGALAVPQLLAVLGCETVVINGEPTGEFAHPPEPTPDHLAGLSERVRAERADLGLAVDPDADRLALVDEQGRAISEEYTVTLAALSVLSSVILSPFDRLRVNSAKNLRRRDPSPAAQDDVVVVVNLSTTRMVDDVAARFGARVVRTPVGERYVVEGMRAHGALIGGEGNGGVIYPRSHEGRDALVGAALVLDLLARRGTTLPQLCAELPRYVMRKEKLPLHDRRQLPRVWEELQKLADRLPDARCSTTDGVRLDTPEGWVHLRPSNTEPVIRLIGEAASADALSRLFSTVRAPAATIRSRE